MAKDGWSFHGPESTFLFVVGVLCAHTLTLTACQRQVGTPVREASLVSYGGVWWWVSDFCF